MSGICGVVFADQHRHLHAADRVPMVQALTMTGQGEEVPTSVGAIGFGVQGSFRRFAAVVDKASASVLTSWRSIAASII